MNWQNIDIEKFTKGTAPRRFLEIADVCWSTGYSRCVSVDELDPDMQFGNGADWARTDGSLGRYFNIHREKKRGRISHIQLVGFRKSAVSGSIPKEVYEAYRKEVCRILATHSRKCEIDHKDGRKDVDVGAEKEAFQPLSKPANDAKRQHCKVCKQTGQRFDATQLGYSVSQWIGPKEYKGSCVGCFWYDPKEFNNQVSSNFVKQR
ncbi:hypothetical protein CKO28_06145 [Rhodovibrio sodomensis]|uniref:Restriction endonuclease n=1 Tax=Rhodovibrio sodomensis TaxID=1088 RepID=A0ABS1DCY9_9PROT|nr:hypothetical protein [Rhodovibrio sodomensis]MBK1667613.1 hypothetical protein [Rhodovibrio sodomensis]